MLKLNLSSLFFFVCLSLFAQHPSYLNYTTNDGLPSNEVYHVLQDSMGYMWFATDNGVCRFDGYNFRVFSDAEGLPSNVILDLFLDHKGKVWFLAKNGLLAYFENDEIVEYNYNDSIEKYFHEGSYPFKNTFNVDKENNITMSILGKWMLTISYSGECKTDQGIDSVLTLRKYNEKYYPLISNYGYLYDTLALIDKDTCYIVLKGPQGHIDPRLFIDEIEDTLIFNVYKKILFVANGMVVKSIPSDKRILYYKRDQKQRIWLSFLNKGVYCYKNKLSGNFKVYFKEHSISYIFEDKGGGMWFSTLDNGIFYMPNINIDTIAIKNIVSITANQSKLWFCSQQNYIYALDENKINKYSADINEIKDLCWDEELKRLYFTHDKGAGFIHRNNFSFLHISAEIYQALKLNDGNILFTVYGNYYIMRSDTVYHFSQEFNKTTQPKCYMYMDNKGVLWSGSKFGLAKIVHSKYELIGEKIPLLKKEINVIIGYKDGLLLGTKSAGVIYYSSDTILVINKTSGLSDNNITCIKTDENLNIWVGTKKGINKISNAFDPIKQNIFQIHEFHGINSENINDIYTWKGQIYVATNTGLNIIKPDKILLNETGNIPFIKNVAILDKDTNIQSIYTLSHKQNTISIDFLCINYRLSGKIDYKYRFSQDDRSSKWEYTQNTNLRFSFLPPGNYKFELYACNEDGIWSNKGQELSFLIKKPYWATWWFYALIFIGVVTIVGIIFYVIFKIRTNEIKKRQKIIKEENEKRAKLQNQLTKFRQQALSQQMNPHFIFNTLNSIQYFIYKNDKKASNKYLSMFSKLMRKTLDNSQHSEVPLEDELNLLNIYMTLEKLRYKDKFSFEMNIDKSIDTSDYKIPTLILQPYVENAIWHGIANKEGPGNIKLNISIKNDYLQCIIEDNGIGREKAMEIKKSKQKTYHSYGTKITENRLNLLNQLSNKKLSVTTTDLYSENNKPAGTKITIYIPKIG